MGLIKRRNKEERNPLSDKTNKLVEEDVMLTRPNNTRRISSRLESQKLNISKCDNPIVTKRTAFKKLAKQNDENRKKAATPTQRLVTRNSIGSNSIRKPNLKVTSSSQKKQIESSKKVKQPVVILKRISFKATPIRSVNDKAHKVVKESTAEKSKPASVACDTSNTERVLRKRITKNYADLSSQDVLSDKKDESHVPVYLKALSGPPEKKQKDPFEFTFHSPFRRRNKVKPVIQKRLQLGSKKGTRKPKNDVTSRDSDASFHVFTKAVGKKLKKNKKPNEPCVFKELFVKPKPKNTNVHHKVKCVEQKGTVDKVAVPSVAEESRKPYRKSIEESAIRSDDDDESFGFDDYDDWQNKDVTSVLPSTTGVTNRKKEVITKRLDLLTSTPMQSLSSKSPNSANKNSVSVISNIIISPPKPKTSTNSNANLTKSSRTSSDKTSLLLSSDFEASKLQSPWRSDDLSVRRNPHFLTMKSTTSLPCYNQEMILEPRLLELPAFDETPRLDPNEVTLKQTNILDYFNDHSSTIVRSPEKANFSQTLFDDDSFSPLKSKRKTFDENSFKSPEKENFSQTLFDDDSFSPLKSKRKTFGENSFKSPKRKRVALSFGNEISPLGEKDDINSEENIMSNEHEIDDFFGFNDSEDKENTRANRRSSIRLKYKKKSNAGPMRVPAEEIKTVKDVIQNKCLEKLVETEKELEKLPEVVETSLQEEDAPYVGIFEELQQLSTKKYVRKRPKRTRFASVERDEPVESEKQKRKRNDGRTKSEEDALNKWAAQFNALCDEIDKHELETA